MAFPIIPAAMAGASLLSGLCGGTQGKPMEQTSMLPPWAQNLGKQYAQTVGQGMSQGATRMPQDLFGAMMGASQVPSFAYGPMQFLNQMYGGGMPYQPMQFNPMDLYQSIYGQQQQAMPGSSQGGNYYRPPRKPWAQGQ